MQLDELNILRSKTRQQVAKKKIRDYFEVMELLAYLIEERIDLAFTLYVESYQFLIRFTESLNGKGKSEKEKIAEKYVEIFKSTYRNTLRKNNVPEEVIDALDEHITKTAEDVVKTTLDNDKKKSNMDEDEPSEEKKPSQTTPEAEIDKRAILIAETETNVAKNTEQYIQAVADGKTKKTWVTMRDDRVRDTHVPMEGKTIGRDELFNVNGSFMRFPGDYSKNANSKEIIGCRCIVEYHN